MRTYITIGYCANASGIVYAGENKVRAMNTNLYPEYHAFNVDVWENGEKVCTYFKNKMIDDNNYDSEDKNSEWEYILIKE